VAKSAHRERPYLGNPTQIGKAGVDRIRERPFVTEGGTKTKCVACSLRSGGSKPKKKAGGPR